MTNPFSDAQRYRPGQGGTSDSFAVGGTSAASSALTTGSWYQVTCTCACHWRVGESPTAVTTDPVLDGGEVSQPFKLRDGETVAAIRVGSANTGTMYVNAIARDAV